jgi:hypothetical protein
MVVTHTKFKRHRTLAKDATLFSSQKHKSQPEPKPRLARICRVQSGKQAGKEQLDTAPQTTEETSFFNIRQCN